MQWRNREKGNDQEHHVKVSFFHLADKKIFLPFLLLVMLFVFEKMSSLPSVACYVICSCSKTFFKTNVHKNFAILYSQENTCVGATF